MQAYFVAMSPSLAKMRLLAERVTPEVVPACPIGPVGECQMGR
jgi:hypothetical protein